MKVRHATKALLDLDSIAGWIQKDSTRAALRFLESAEETANQIADFPELGAPVELSDPELKGLRHCLISGFKRYVLFYRIVGEDIVIMRVLHGHRDLSIALKEAAETEYWIELLRETEYLDQTRTLL